MQPKGISLCTPIPCHAHDTATDTFSACMDRIANRRIQTEAQITGDNETLALNVFEFTGTITIISQFGIITDATALTNATNIYATAYDGTNSVPLTADGISFSGAPVGTTFTKDKLAAETYSLALADEVRLLETKVDKKVGRPFTLVGKNGVTNYIRFHITTNATLNFKMWLEFDFALHNGATLELV